MKQRSAVAIANEQVAIEQVFRWCGIYIPEIPEGRTLKIHCPFGEFFHPDKGVKPDMRIYPSTNSAYCFQCGYFSPVWLACQLWDRQPNDVALDLLQRTGYKPVSIAQLWADSQIASKPVDVAPLGLALRTYCQRIDPDWSTRQFDSDISSTLSRCLSLLSHVTTEADVHSWLETCKLVLKTALANED